MLTPPNSALVERDPALPGLALLLDPAALAMSLGTPRAVLRHLRYKPGTSCAAVAEDAAGDWHRLRALTPARFAERGGAQDGALGAARIEHGSPARDREVPGLRSFWTTERRAAAMAKLFGEHRLVTSRLEPLSYRLGRRLVARLAHPGGDALLKLHTPGRHAQALAGAMAAAAAGHAPLLAACSRRLAVVTAWVPGRTLAASEGPGGFAEAGAALARVHETPVAPPFTQSRPAEIAAVQETLRAAALLAPELAADLQDLAQRLAAALAGTAAEPGTIHGDFSADQVIVTDGGACLIDWDRAGHGDCARDIGSALARLDADGLFDGLADAAVTRAQDAFLEGYEVHRPLPPAWEVQRLAHLALLIGEPFRRQLPDWPSRMGALVTEVRRGLDRLTAEGPSDPALGALATLLSDPGARHALESAGCGAPTAAPRLMRHKPGRRAMVKIAAAGPDGPRTWLAKIRSRRPDHDTPALHRALRAAGFDSPQHAAFGVPDMREGPVGFRTVLLEHVAGRPLSDLQGPGCDTAPFAATGRALAALHDTAIDPGRTWTHEQEISVADAALGAAAERNPDAAATISTLRGWLHDQPPDTSGPVLLHRDFYPDQVLVDGDWIWIIDLDLAALGTRHVDLGNMLAHMTEYGLRAFGDAEALAPQMRSFVEGYRAGGGHICDRALARLHIVSLLRHLSICQRIAGRGGVWTPLLRHLETRVRAARPVEDLT